MKRKINVFIAMLLVSLFVSCFDDTGTSGPKGTLKITVNTSSEIFSYPKLKDGSTTEYEAYSGDTLYTWQYPEVGGDGNPAEEENLSGTLITSSTEDQGDKINIVYLYSSLGDSAKDTPVVYKGELSENGLITITDIIPGDYYVVAFYDYSGGGNLENLLNRYDRYAIYTSSEPYGGTSNSTPFKDKATVLTINENQISEITLDIQRDWVLGKPNTGSGGTGRLFLLSTTDPVPTPDGTH